MSTKKENIDDFIRRTNAALEALAQQAGGRLPDAAAAADHLNRQGLRTYRGRRWNAETLRKYLSSRAYKEEGDRSGS